MDCRSLDQLRTQHNLEYGDALQAGLLALSDPRPLSLPLDEAVQAHADMLASLSGCGSIAVWTLDTGAPVVAAHAGPLSYEATRSSAIRAYCEGASAEPVVVVRAFGEPCAMIAWTDRVGGEQMTRTLAQRSAELLTLAFERAVLLDGSVAQHAALARSAERRLSRVALDLHDGPLQDIALLRGELAALHGSLSASAGNGSQRDPLATVEDLLAIAEATEADMRELARSMESASLLKRPLDESLRSSARAFALRTGIEPRVQLNGDLAGLTNMERVALLRVVGEALANAREHSGATAVEIAVSVGEAEVVASVSDNGCGFQIETALPEGARRGSLGLLGMMERARLLGGACHVQSRAGAGTAVTVRFDRYFPAQAAGATSRTASYGNTGASLRVA